MATLPKAKPGLSGMLLAAAVAPLLYCAFILACSVNVPVGDDYSVLGFLGQFHALAGLGDKLEYLLSFHNEHRIALTRALMLLSAQINGSLDFRLLNLIGNSAFLVALVVLGRMLRFGGDWWKWALLFLIALQPQPLKLMFYPMAGVQAYFGLLFSLLYLQFSLKDPRVSYLALLFYLLTVLTTGSGIFLALVGVPILLCKRRYLEGALHVALAVLVVWFYAPSSSNLPYLAGHPGSVLQFFLLLLGNVAQFPMLSSDFLQIMLGLAFLSYFAYFAWDGLLLRQRLAEPRYLATLGCLLYLLMVIGLIAVGRTEIYQADLAGASLDGRYRIYSMLFLAVCGTDLLARLRERDHSGAQVTTVVVTVALLFNLLWFAPSFIQMRFQAQQRVAAMQQWRASGDVTVLPIWSITPEEAQANLELAVKSGTYRP